MIEYIMKKVLSLTISALLLYVPKDKVLKEMAAIPGMEERVAGVDLKGWRLEKAASERTGMTHYYYHYRPANPAARMMVCIHGFNTDGRVFLNVSELSDRFELVAYNLPEESPYYTGTMSDFTVILNDFLQVIGADTVVFAANSMGGAVVMHYCASNPAVTVEGLVLLSTAVFGATAEDSRRYRGMADKLLPYEDYKLYYLLEKGQSIVGRLERAGLGDNAPGDAIVTKRIGWYRQVLSALYDYNGADDARKISCPVIAIHGSADKVIAPASARTITQFIPQARLYFLDGVGHSMVYSDARAVAEKIRGFITTQAVTAR